jgi:hypothetical protein
MISLVLHAGPSVATIFVFLFVLSISIKKLNCF